MPWCQNKLVGAEGSRLYVFGSAVVGLSIGGESIELSVAVIDPLTSKAILGLDVLNQCTVDLLHGRLITGTGHVVSLCSQGQGQHPECKTNLVDVRERETVNINKTADTDGSVNTSETVSTGVPENIKEQKTNLVDVSKHEMVSINKTLDADGSINTSETVNTGVLENQSMLEQLVDASLLQELEGTSVVAGESGDAIQATSVSDTVKVSQMSESGHVLTVKVIDNIRIPAFSEMEVLARGKGDSCHCYMLENNLKNSELLVARAVVMSGEFVQVRLLNPTGESINLYSGANVAVLPEVTDIMENHSGKCNRVENTVMVSAVGGDNGDALLEEMLAELVEDTSLSSHHHDLLLAILIDYSDIFARSRDELGHTDVLQHEIITDGASPIRQRFRRLSPEKRAEMSMMLSDMLKKNLISPSKSPWAAPIVLVTKKDGTSRCYVDYCQVNSVTRKDAYPLPRVDDILETQAGSQLFSTLDLASGYWQVEVKPEDREKTTFITSEGRDCMNLMFYPLIGLCNGPATFQ